jgi:hypothetical protein
MKRLLVLLTALLLLVTTIGVPVAIAATGDVVVPVTGKIKDHPGMSFKGRVVNPEVTYSPTKDVLRVSGTLRGTLTKASGATLDISKQFQTTAVAQTGTDTGGFSTAQATSCSILNLDIGRIHLDLLGLVVDLSPIHLDVTAVPGAGNLLGNLLCAVAGLLDPNTFLADFHNQLLGRLFTV